MKINNIGLVLAAALLLVLLFVSCGQGQKANAGFLIAGGEVPYALNQPDSVFALPKKLSEISGLSFDDTNGHLIAIDDEKGELYFLDKNTSEIIEKIEFGDDRDYEGVVRVGQKVYVLESDGDIFTFDMLTRKKSTKFESDRGDDVDFEGLTYHPPSKSLLLATKSRRRKQKKDDHSRTIFKLDPNNQKELVEFTKIDLSANFDSLSSKGIGKGAFYNLIVMQRLRDFAPSGISIRPTTQEIYILSSQGGSLVVLDPTDYHVKAILFLKKSVHVQPEGICFDDDDNLYIANEARGRSARLYLYRPHADVKVIDESKSSVVDLLTGSDSTSNDTTGQ